MSHNVITDNEKLGYDDISQNGVKGPASSSDNKVAAFDGVTGKLLKETNISLDSSGAGTKYLNDAGAYTIPADAGGDVVGPASSVNNTIPQFDGVTGKLIKDSSVVLQTSGPGNEFLAADGVYKTPAGSGDVAGPSISVNGTVPLFDGTTGKLIKDSNISLQEGGTGLEYLSNAGHYSELDVRTYLASANGTDSQYLYVGEFSNFFFTDNNEAVFDVWGNGDYELGQDIRQFHYQLCVRKGGQHERLFIDYHLLNDELDNDNKLSEAIAYYNADGRVRVYLRAKAALTYNQALIKLTLNNGSNNFTKALTWSATHTAPAYFILHDSGGTWIGVRSCFTEGPSSSTDSHIATFNGSTGKILKDSGVLIKTGGPATEFLNASGGYTVPAGGGGSTEVAIRSLAASDTLTPNSTPNTQLKDSGSIFGTTIIKTVNPAGGYTLSAGNYTVDGKIDFIYNPNSALPFQGFIPKIRLFLGSSDHGPLFLYYKDILDRHLQGQMLSCVFTSHLIGVTEDQFFGIRVTCSGDAIVSGFSCNTGSDSFFKIVKI